MAARAGGFRVEAGARPLRSWTTQDCDALARVFEPAWREWLSGWASFADGADAIVSAAPLARAADSSRQWQALGRREAGAALLAGGLEQGEGAVHWLLFGELAARRSLSQPVAEEVRGRAWADLIERLCRAAGAQPVNDAGVVGGPGGAPIERRHENEVGGGIGIDLTWAGDVEIVLECTDARIQLLGDASMVGCLLHKPPAGKRPFRSPVTPLASALATQTIHLRAVLEPVELTLGDLAQLRPGDLVALQHALDSDVALVDDAGTRVLAGFLGQSRQHRSVQLSPGPSPSLLP